MHRQRPAVFLVGNVVKLLKRLRIQHAHQKIQAGVVVRYHAENRALFLPQPPNIHLVAVCDAGQLRQIEGRKPDRRADEDAFRGFVLRLLEHLVLLERNALRLFAFQLVKQQVQRTFEIRVALPHLRRVDHLHDHREVLLAHRRSVLQIQNERLQERRLRTVPERVRVFRVLRRRVRHKVRDKPQRVAVSAQIGEGIVMAAHIHKVQHRERDALLFKQPAHGAQNLALAVCDNI